MLQPLPVLAQTSLSDAEDTDKPAQSITLKDGTLIKGHLEKIEDDTYTIKTQHMGLINVQASDIDNISNSQNTAPSTNTSYRGQIQQMQQSILKNPQTMSAIQDLANDQEIVNLLKDPELLKVIMAMDPAAAKNNPKIQDLMNNPKMKSIINQMMASPTFQP